MKNQVADFYTREDVEFNAMNRAKSVLKNIKRYSPNARNILELGVGVGDIIKHFPQEYLLSGLDIDKDAIAAAKKKYSHIDLFYSDMRYFKYKKQDVIFCVFDSLNYLKRALDLRQTFNNVVSHLNTDGLFIFDIYSENILNFQGEKLVFLEESSGYYFDRVTKKNDFLYWNSICFESRGKGTYKKRTYEWKERVFAQVKVEEELKKNFQILKRCDAESLGRLDSRTRRILYVARFKKALA